LRPTSLLLSIPDEYKPIAALAIGSVILVVLVLFHGISLHRILVLFKRGEIRLRTGRPHLGRAGLLFGWAVFLILTLHIMEIAAWSFALMRMGLIIKPADALYFCANAYTTLGYGTVDLGVNWRNISPIIAISGLFTFAWTTSSLVSIVNAYLKLVEQLELERVEQLALRVTERKAVWDSLAKEREAERTLHDDTKKRAAEASFFARRKIWKEEKQQVREMETAEKAEIREIRRKEGMNEDALGQGPPPEKSGGEK
jgi:hypothetical protein